MSKKRNKQVETMNTMDTTYVPTVKIKRIYTRNAELSALEEAFRNDAEKRRAEYRANRETLQRTRAEARNEKIKARLIARAESFGLTLS